MKWLLCALAVFSWVCAAGQTAAGNLAEGRDHFTHALLFWVLAEVSK